ncbi:hypothetical protein BCU81_00045 [Vibrio breoganii]|nr:hypothetical protein BCU81_00045 [Vibrio breoganii]
MNISFLCLALSAVVNIILFFLMCIDPYYVNAFLVKNDLSEYWYLIPLVAFLFSIQEILTVWTIRIKKFGSLSRSAIFQSFSNSGSKVILGNYSATTQSLIYALIITYITGIIVLISGFSKNVKINTIKISKMLFLIRYYRNIPLYRLPSQAVLSFCMNMPVLYISTMYNPHTTGQLGLALTVLALPIDLIGKTIGQAFYGSIAQLGRNRPKDIYELSKDVVGKLFLCSLLPFLIIFTYGNELFTFIFGSNWLDAGLYAEILSIYIVANLISSPIVNVLNVLNKNKSYLFINLFRLLIVGLGFYFSYYQELDIKETLWIYSLCITTHYILSLLYIFRVLKNKVLLSD